MKAKRYYVIGALVFLLGCQLYAQPKLYGLQVKGGNTLGQRYLVTANPKTAQIDILSSNSIFGQYTNGDATMDPVNGVYYSVARDAAGETRLFGIDIETGKVLSDPKLSDPNDIHQLEFNCSDGNLYAIEVGPLGRYFVKVDPTTASITRLFNTVVIFSSYNNGSSTLDFYKGVYYILGRDGSGRQRMFGIDVTTGLIASSPVLADPNAIHHLAFNCRDSTIYGVQVEVNPGLSKRFLSKIDPVTGQVTVISKQSIFNLYGNGSPAIDPFKGIYHVLGLDSSNNMRLYSIDITTGNVLYRPQLKDPNDIHQLVYYNPCFVSPDFSFRDSCFGNRIKFKTQTAGLVEWDFGDPASGTRNFSEGYNPWHVFSDTGTFEVKLKVTGCFNTDSLTQKVRISLLNRKGFLGNDTSICEGDTLLLDATTRDAAVTWQDNSIQPTYRATAEGDYVASIAGNKCKLIDTIRISFKTLPELYLGPDTQLCGQDSLLLSDAVTNATYKWQDASSDSVFQVKSAGLYWLERTIEGCSARDSISITYGKLPIVELVGDTQGCQGDTIQLEVQGTPGVYAWSQGGKGKSIQVVQRGSYSVTVTAGGCSATDSIQVSILDTGNLVILHDTFGCDRDSMLLRASRGEGEYLWQDGSKGPEIAVYNTGVFWLRRTNRCGVFSDTAHVFFDRMEELELGPDTLLCFGENLLLDGTVENADRYSWLDGSSTPTYRVYSPGTYVLEVQRDRCFKTDSIRVDIRDEIEVGFEEDTLLCEGKNLLLDASNEGATYQWNTGSENSSIVVSEGGAYSVTIKVGDCSAEESIQVLFEDCEVRFEIPNVFSPNADNFNDVWKASIAQNIDSISTTVFNRWGQEVYNSDELSINWNGQNEEGQRLAPGVYFYIIQYVDRYQNREELKGSITLLR